MLNAVRVSIFTLMSKCIKTCLSLNWNSLFAYSIRFNTAIRVLKIEEIFQVISINVIRWKHSLMTWINLRVLKLWPSVYLRENINATYVYVRSCRLLYCCRVFTTALTVEILILHHCHAAIYRIEIHNIFIYSFFFLRSLFSAPHSTKSILPRAY